MSKKKRRPGGNPAKRAWEPMHRVPLNPQANLAPGRDYREAWTNNIYQCTVQYTDAESGRDGMIVLSIKRHDRAAIRDWRHLQQIKNDVAGAEREAAELFPAESRLMDTSNQYWLHVAPAGTRFPFGFESGAVSDDETLAAFNAAPHPGLQRPWQEGLTTGRLPQTPLTTTDDARVRAVLDHLGGSA